MTTLPPPPTQPPVVNVAIAPGSLGGQRKKRPLAMLALGTGLVALMAGHLLPAMILLAAGILWSAES